MLDQLCNEYAYAVHQPHARNGGLIGLAAAAIALGSVSHTRPGCIGGLVTDLVSRSSRNTSRLLFHPSLPALQTRMPGLGTMPAKLCTT